MKSYQSTLNLFLACCSKNSSPNPLWFPNPYADAVFRLAWKWSLLSFPSIPPFASLSFCSQPDFLLYLLNLGTSPIRAKENSFTLNHHPPLRHWPCPCTVCIANTNLCHLHPKMHLIYILVWRLQLHRISVIAPTKLHLLSTQSNKYVGICHKLVQTYPKKNWFLLRWWLHVTLFYNISPYQWHI